ncbi:MAG TPA: polysaccharide pyruvyl transferase family protein, partial [Oligoflexia bacterium]|nr:polysaccharide pyruvyl transferase family protein [Oligoflexia bacterium]
MNAVKLTISGGFGFGDLGDEAMLSEYLRCATEHLGLKREQIFLVSANPDYTSSYHRHPRELCCRLPQETMMLVNPPPKGKVKRAMSVINHISIKRKLSELAGFAQRSDGLLITGGGIINTRDEKGFSIKRIAGITRFFCAHGVPVFMSGQTIGPLGINRMHDELAAEIVNSVDCLTVRDSFYSRRYLQVVGGKPKELVETIDDASALEADFASVPAEWKSKLVPDSYIAFNVSEYTSDTAAKREFAARLVDHLLRCCGMPVVMVAHAPIDYAALWEIFDLLQRDSKANVHVPDTREWRAEQVKGLISRASFALGGRYHFVVFSATAGVPFIGLAGNHYSYIKQDGFARAFSLEHCILNPVETWDFAAVSARIEQIRGKKTVIAGKISYPLPSMLRFMDWLKQIEHAKTG